MTFGDFRRTHFVHIHSLSATVSRNKGSTNQSSSRSIFPGTESSGIWPMGRLSRGSVHWSSSMTGRRLWLHLPMTVPWWSKSSPGLLRMMVFRVISSVWQKGYSAPVMSRQWLMAPSVLAVKQ